MARFSLYLSTALVENLVTKFFNEHVVPKMEQFGEKNLAIWVAFRVPGLSFEECVLFSMKRNIMQGPFEGPCNIIAKSKCVISWRTGLSSREVTDLHPELLLPGETAYPGSTVNGNLVVAISGLPDQWDEALSIQLAAEILGEVRFRHAANRKAMAQNGEHFLPEA